MKPTDLIIRPTTTPAPAGDLAGAFADFLRLNVAAGDASPRTIAAYMSEIEQYTRWANGQGIDPARAVDSDLAAYRRWLVDSGYKRSTIATKLAAIRRLYEAAVWRGLRPDNPAAGLKPPKEKAARADRVKFLPLEGFRRLLALPDPATPAGARDRAILAVLGRHGLRVSEVAGLDVADLDLESEPPALTVTGKGKKTRIAYLTATTAGILRAWLAQRPALAREGEPALFVALDNAHAGGRMSARAVRYLVDRYLDRAGLKAAGLSCHSLRHSYATWSLAGGAKLESIQDSLGHVSIETTRVYAQIVDRIQENPARYLESLLGG